MNNRDGNRTQNFSYDNLNRITQGNTTGANWGETFTIDAWSNLTNRGSVAGKTSYEPLAAPATTLNQLTGFGYDAAGNMTSNGAATYTYDQENRMTGTAGVSYLFDGDGQRVKKASPASLYWYGATGNVLDETSGSGVLVSEYIFFNGKRVARRDADNTVKYYFADNLGSASVITNATGAMPPLEESDYYPYGGEIPITNGDPNHYKFTGKERDTESGLDNFGARFFTSNLGRFMTPDWAARPTAVPYAVFGDPQSLNLYTYVENAPVNRVDADGHYCIPAGLQQWCSYDPSPGDKESDQEKKSNPPNHSAQNQATRQNVADTAQKYNGSTDWAFKAQKGAFACNTNKCNAFVGDVTKEAGAPASVKGSDGKSRYPLAAEWADKKTCIANWRTLGKDETPQPGDVGAYKLSGGGARYSGHSGIITSVDPSGVHAMAAHENVVGPDNKFDRSVTPTVVYRRFTGDE